MGTGAEMERELTRTYEAMRLAASEYEIARYLDLKERARGIRVQLAELNARHIVAELAEMGC